MTPKGARQIRADRVLARMLAEAEADRSPLPEDDLTDEQRRAAVFQTLAAHEARAEEKREQRISSGAVSRAHEERLEAARKRRLWQDVAKADSSPWYEGEP